jgi:hypothetical protein
MSLTVGDFEDAKLAAFSENEEAIDHDIDYLPLALDHPFHKITGVDYRNHQMVLILDGPVPDMDITVSDFQAAIDVAIFADSDLEDEEEWEIITSDPSITLSRVAPVDDEKILFSILS